MLALLQCENADGALIALPLCHSREEGGSERGLFIGTHIPCSKRSHQPFHIVCLTEGALAEALRHVLPTTSEASLLRQYSHPAIPKSQLDPGVRGSRMGRVDLWPGDKCNGVVFQITPRSVDALAALSFAPSALQVTRSEEKITLETTLAYTGEGHTLDDGERRQTVRLRITLRQQKFGDFWFLTLWDTKACFFVENVLKFPPRNIALSPSSDSSQSSSTADVPISSTMKETPKARNSISEFDSQSTWRRLLLQADFIIHSDPHWKRDACTVRLLRVALERPLGSFVGDDTKNVSLSIELSEKYRYAHPVIPTLSSAAPSGSTQKRQKDRALGPPSAGESPVKRIRVAPPQAGPTSASPLIALKPPGLLPPESQTMVVTHGVPRHPI